MSTNYRNLFQGILEGGGLLVAAVLPVVFNPFSERPFEPTKVIFFRWTVAVMAVAFCAIWRVDLKTRSEIPGSQSRRRPSHSIAVNPLAPLALAYGGVFILSSMLSVNPLQSLWGWEDKHGTVTLGCLVLFFLIIEPLLRSHTFSERIISALLMGSVPVVFYAVTQFVGMDPLEWVTDSIAPTLSTMGRSNFLGAYLAMVIPFTFYRMTNELELRKKGHSSGSTGSTFLPLQTTVLFFLQMVCLVLTQARAAWLGFIGAGCLFVGALAYLRCRRRFLPAFGGTLLLGALLYIGLSHIDFRPPCSTTDTHVGMSFGEMRENTVESRFVIWRHTLDLVPERWLFGHGAESFVTIFNERYPPDMLWGRSDLFVADPHNIVLAHLFSVGVLGLLVWISIVTGFYLIVFDGLRRRLDRKDQVLLTAASSSATAYLIQSQFNPEVIVVAVVFWLTMAVGVGRICASRQAGN